MEEQEQNEWECSNCGYGDNPYCRDCENEKYIKEEERKELKKEVKQEILEELKNDEFKTLKDIFFNLITEKNLK